MSAFRPTHRVTTDHEHITLPHKPSAPLACTYRPPTTTTSSSPSNPPRLLVFLNGLALPQSAWQPTISLLCGERETIKEGIHDPPVYGKQRGFGILTYDRFGQGETSARDPNDELEGKDKGFGHDLNEVVADLGALIKAIAEEKYPASRSGSGSSVQPIVSFCANSIGCAIARHYAAVYPGTVSSLILLDPIVANSNFTTDVFPDPSSPEFNLPLGIKHAQYDSHRREYAKRFAPTGCNNESFDRRNMAIILPSASSPILIGTDAPLPPILRIVSHDPETFAEDSLRDLGSPLVLTETYTHASMDKYNQALLGICPGRNVPEGADGPRVIIARGSGHFVQKDAPGLVSGLVEEVLREAGW